MRVWQEQRWPYQWLGECDGTSTTSKNHASIRCNSEADAKEFMTRNECCPAIDAETAKAIKFEKDRLHREVANLNEQKVVRLQKALTDESNRSSALFKEAVEWKRRATDATNTDTKLIRERDAAVKHSELGQEINGNLRGEIDRLAGELEETIGSLAVEKLITDRQHEEIIRLKAQILSAGINAAQEKLEVALKVAQALEKEWRPYIFPVVPAPKDDSWLKYDH